MVRYFLITIFLFTGLCRAQDYVQKSISPLSDWNYVNTIKTITLKPSGNEFGLPIVRLGGRERLVLDFDDLGPDFTQFQYTIIHCTHDWQPSNLMKSEYLDGMHDYFFTEYEFSMNTWMPYTHYRVSLPNESMRITKSGNYVVMVYRNNDPEDLVLTRRFMVYEERVNVTGNIVRATRLEERDTHQQLNFTLNHGGYDIPNPFLDLHVTVIQNGRWDNARFDMKPKFIRNAQMDYNFEGENTFYGGNEFRNFDTKQLNELTLNVRRTVLEDVYNIFLASEVPRNALRYSFLEDINGRFVIRRLNSAKPESEADYAKIDFFLKTEPYEEGTVYVFGQLSDWQVKDEFRLKYDYESRAYRGQILLKQGYYNYQYVLLDYNTLEVDETAIEGSHWETSNEYTILVYHRELGIRYDRLVGIRKLVDFTGMR